MAGKKIAATISDRRTRRINRRSSSRLIDSSIVPSIIGSRKRHERAFRKWRGASLEQLMMETACTYTMWMRFKSAIGRHLGEVKQRVVAAVFTNMLDFWKQGFFQDGDPESSLSPIFPKGIKTIFRSRACSLILSVLNPLRLKWTLSDFSVLRKRSSKP